MKHCLIGFCTLWLVADSVWAQTDDLNEFRTVANALTTVVQPAPKDPVQPAYLGVHVEEKGNTLLVVHVDPDSPAQKAGVVKGDVLLTLGSEKLTGLSQLRQALDKQRPGTGLLLQVRRGDKAHDLPLTFAAVSQPMDRRTPRAVLGLKFSINPNVEGLKIQSINEISNASKSGLKVGDLVVKIDDHPVATMAKFTELLGEKKPGQFVAVAYKRGETEATAKVKLMAEKLLEGQNQSWDTRSMDLWKKDTYRLGVVLVEFADMKLNEKITPKDWEDSLFSQGTYKNKKNATGQNVFGSLNDYYQEISYGSFRLEGKVLPAVQVNKKRVEYTQSANRYSLYQEALDKILAREDGKDTLNKYDGFFFVYAGPKLATQRGGVFSPHRAIMKYQGRNVPYFICPEGGPKMDSISVTSHEFGHMLGLPDLYARPESPGAEGLGKWCNMSTGHGDDGKPLHFSAWCKEKLGWLKPAVLDPRVKQKLILKPVYDSPRECYKILLTPDASEYLLLENRVSKGFDRDLPAQGLLIWRVVNGRPFLEESHGIDGPSGPLMYLGLVPYPSKSNHSFTPYTTPSSRSPLGQGWPVHITNIRRLQDGRITFFVGYEYF